MSAPKKAAAVGLLIMLRKRACVLRENTHCCNGDASKTEKDSNSVRDDHIVRILKRGGVLVQDRLDAQGLQETHLARSPLDVYGA